MLFNSISFAIFLPIVFTLYWILPHKYRCGLLLIASYYFYISWNPKYIVLILSTTAVSYFAGILIEKKADAIYRKCILIGTAIFCLGVVFFFKYFNFFGETITAILRLFSIQLHPITSTLLLPVGISFYAFQTLSYVIDVYTGKSKAEHNFGIYATFISFFPQLVAGPIERTNNLLPQIKSEKKFDYDLAMYGARQMLWGFFKKIAVADFIAVYVDAAYSDLANCTSFDLCVAVFFFTIQIYCDFSGYSDIAIGTSKLFGINLMTNFRSPYFSLSIKEFWSRWHISLSTWFRDYVYIPLGGNRCSNIKNYANLMITFLVSGLWHGANWTFVFWGGIHGLAQIVEKMWGRQKANRGCLKTIRWIGVFIFCNIAWVFFRAPNFEDAIYVLSNIFGNVTNIEAYMHTNIGLTITQLMFSVSTIVIVFAYDYFALTKDLLEWAAKANKLLIIGVEYLLLFIIGLVLVYGSGSNQFVYFQF